MGAHGAWSTGNLAPDEFPIPGLPSGHGSDNQRCGASRNLDGWSCASSPGRELARSYVPCHWSLPAASSPASACTQLASNGAPLTARPAWTADGWDRSRELRLVGLGCGRRQRGWIRRRHRRRAPLQPRPRSSAGLPRLPVGPRGDSRVEPEREPAGPLAGRLRLVRGRRQRRRLRRRHRLRVSLWQSAGHGGQRLRLPRFRLGAPQTPLPGPSSPTRPGPSSDTPSPAPATSTGTATTTSSSEPINTAPARAVRDARSSSTGHPRDSRRPAPGPPSPTRQGPASVRRLERR